tara:strand:- start:209 stop:436 length:228 start_codon:yes stop_codon:yes gene_type:complete
MEKINEITTKNNNGANAFDIIMECKNLANCVDLTNIIIDNTSIDEKEMLIKIVENIRNLELEIIEQPFFIPEAKA